MASKKKRSPKVVTKAKAQIARGIVDDDDADEKLLARIDELESDNIALRAQLKEFADRAHSELDEVQWAMESAVNDAQGRMKDLVDEIHAAAC